MIILVIDDHNLFLDGFLHLLSNYDSNNTLLSATTTNDALEKIRGTQQPNFILLDLSFPGLDGVSFLNTLQRERADIPVAIVSSMDEPKKIREALNLGAVGFIPKSFSVEQMQHALDELFSGNIFIPEEIRLVLSRDNSQVDDAARKLKLTALNMREKQLLVLQRMAEGKIVQQISEDLNVSPNTIKTHIKKIYQTLNVSSRVAAIAEARRLGLLD